MDPGRQETSIGVRLELRAKTLRWRRRTREEDPMTVKGDRGVLELKTLRSRESQGRKGREQAISFLGFEMNKL